MELEVNHTLTIKPTKGYIIFNQNVHVHTNSDGNIVIDFKEQKQLSEINTDIIKQKDEKIKALEESEKKLILQVSDLANEPKVRLKDEAYSKRIREISQLLQERDTEIFKLKNLISNKLKAKYQGRECACGCKTMFMPHNVSHKIAPNCPNKNKKKEYFCKCGCGLKFTPIGKNSKYAPNCPNYEQIKKDADKKRQNKHRSKKIENTLLERSCLNCQDQIKCKDNHKCPINETPFFKPNYF